MVRFLTVFNIELALSYTPPLPEPWWTLTVFVGWGVVTIALVLLGNRIANSYRNSKIKTVGRK